MKPFSVTITLVLVLGLLSSCGKKPDVTVVPSPAPVSAAPAPTPEETGPQVVAEAFTPVRGGTGGFRDYQIDLAAPRTDAHKKYLADPLKFAAPPDQGHPTGRTAVVGSRVCLFYPGAKIEKEEDLTPLPPGISVPFGTILPIQGDKIGNPSGDHGGMFQFQDNWNWFYGTTFRGQDGLVFGADLYGLDDTNESNRISALLYQAGGRLTAFYPVLGYRQLSSAITSSLERDRLAFQSVSKTEYALYADQPDDMIALYLKHTPRYYSSAWNRKTPVFVTTDIAAHAQHLMFDRLMQYLEEAALSPRLTALVDSFVTALQDRESDAAAYRETWEKAVLYFQVAQALLALTPDTATISGDYGRTLLVYQDRDKDTVLSAYPEAVRQEVDKIYAAAGGEDSSVFQFASGARSTEDYTQYRPRGHYTKNGALGAYFRAMMWFGRIHFLIARAGAAPLTTANAASSDSTALTLAMEPIALLITDLVKGNADLYKAWSDLFDPITALIGISDDLSFNEVLPLWKDQDVADFGSWTASRENLLKFMELAHQKLRPPAISGSSVWWGPSEGADRNPPMGWRLFGQRFTFDSAIHDQVSPPRLKTRDMVRGLDIMKVFGSRTAESLLQKSDYPRMRGLADVLGGLQKEFDSYDQDFWQRTYYNSVLFQVKAQARFEPGAGYYFTESPAWGTKAMLAAHGTWSELRHDTLLYVKQSGAERAGDGDYEPTFRYEPIPDPVHYLEPNVPFWQGSVLAVQNLIKTLDAYDLLDRESADSLGQLVEIFQKAVDIADAESRDQPLSKADVAWIPTIPARLANMVLLHTGQGDSMSEDQLRMAVIADVYTNFQMGQVLETAVGIPYRVYVPLNDRQGGKRIAVGYVFSYYEFAHPMSDRMTDEAWKGLVYLAPMNLEEYQPFWAKGIALSAETER